MALIRVGAECVVDLTLPRSVVRDYRLCDDTWVVDHRRLRRHLRRSTKKLVAHPFRAWRRAKLRRYARLAA